jgi:hypothetical protein
MSLPAGRRTYKTNRAETTYGLDTNDMAVFGVVLLVTYTALEISVSNLVLKGVILGAVGLATWMIWWPIKDTIQPKIAVHHLGWHATADLLEVRATGRTPVPLCVQMPSNAAGTAHEQSTKEMPALLERPAPHTHPPLEVQP